MGFGRFVIKHGSGGEKDLLVLVEVGLVSGLMGCAHLGVSGLVSRNNGKWHGFLDADFRAPGSSALVS